MTYRVNANRSYRFVNGAVPTHTRRRSRIEDGNVSEDLLIVLGFVAAVVVYAVFTVIRHDRRSREQWRQVDKSKLRERDDEDDW